MDQWLVTGAQGLFGANLGWKLNGTHELIAIARTGAAKHYARTINIDLSNPSEIISGLGPLKPKVIIHAAAVSSHQACDEEPDLADVVNISSTRVLAQYATSIGAKFIYISTDAVFNGASGNYSETSEPSPFSKYGETKLSGEIAALAEARNALVVRTNFFGWSATGHRSILEFFVNSFTSEKSTPGFTNIVVTSTYISTLIDAISVAVESDQSGILNIASLDALSKYEFGEKVCEVFNFNSSHLLPCISSPTKSTQPLTRNLSLNTDKFNLLYSGYLESQLSGIQRARLDLGRRVPIQI